MNLHKVRTSKMSNQLVGDYSYFISEIKEQDSMNTRFIAKDFSMISIIKMLSCLQAGDRPFHDFYLASGFGMKRSFINYSNMCRHFGLIEKEAVGKMYVYYRITEKGKLLLDLFRI